MDREALAAWLRVLDDLTYYALLQVRSDAGPDELKGAFHVFAHRFHPDAHVGRPIEEREAVGRIFRRGTEAYRVLCDPDLRAQYDGSLASGEPPAVASRASTRPPPSSRAPRRLEDAVRSPTARPFARRAEELAKQGDYRQARLQLSLARQYEPNNAQLEALMAALNETLDAQKK